MAGASTGLEREDRQRDAEFNKALHGKSSKATGGVSAMFNKDKEAKKLAVDEYFKHFDNKGAAEETTEDRQVRFSHPLLPPRCTAAGALTFLQS